MSLSLPRALVLHKYYWGLLLVDREVLQLCVSDKKKDTSY